MSDLSGVALDLVVIGVLVAVAVSRGRIGAGTRWVMFVVCVARVALAIPAADWLAVTIWSPGAALWAAAILRMVEGTSRQKRE